MQLPAVNKEWTLFLDRDGVINNEKHNSYIFNKSEFSFMLEADQAVAELSKIFGRTIIVTNQRGVGRGFMTHEDLQGIHDHMSEEVTRLGGRIDSIFYCADLDSQSPNRKPQPGMALQAREAYPEIDFSKSIMVGNTLSDMDFGKRSGMFTVFIQSTLPDLALPHEWIDVAFPLLKDFKAALIQQAMQ